MLAAEREKVIQELRKYRGLCREIKILEEEIEELESRLVYHRGENENRTKVRSTNDYLAAEVAKLVDLTHRRHKVLMQRIEERDRISSAIDSLKEPEERIIMNARYIQGKPWVEVFMECDGKGWSTMFRIHAAAIEKVSKFFRNETK